jgi:hypothetical protein
MRRHTDTATAAQATAGQAPLAVYYLFWREGGYDSFEAGIATERIPSGIEAEFAVMRASRDFSQRFELLDCEVALTRPGTDHGKK